MMLEPEKLQNRGKQGWPDAGKGTGHKGDKKVNTLVRHKWTPIEQPMEFSFLRMRCFHRHKHIYVQVPACTQGVLTVPPRFCYRKRSTNNVSCSLLRLAPQCPHSLVYSLICTEQDLGGQCFHALHGCDMVVTSLLIGLVD